MKAILIILLNLRRQINGNVYITSSNPTKYLMWHSIKKRYHRQGSLMSNILIIGSGPVAIQLAQLCNRVSKNHIDMVGRASTSKKSLDVYQSYQQAGTFTVTTQNDTHHQFAGQFQIRHFIKIFNRLTKAMTPSFWRVLQMLIDRCYSSWHLRYYNM